MFAGRERLRCGGSRWPAGWSRMKASSQRLRSEDGFDDLGYAKRARPPLAEAQERVQAGADVRARGGGVAGGDADGDTGMARRAAAPGSAEDGGRRSGSIFGDAAER